MTNWILNKTVAHKSANFMLVCALALGAGCASKPKPVTQNATMPTATEAAPTSRADTPTTGAPTPLPPIAPPREITEGAEAGLRNQPLGTGAGAGPQVAASLSEAGDRIFFATDRFDLSEEAQTILARQAAWIKSNPSKRVIVAGSADERGTREYNLALGSRRASSARDYLVSLGVNGSSIETVSYGKERPIDARSNPEGWAVNRNAQTQLLD